MKPKTAVVKHSAPAPLINITGTERLTEQEREEIRASLKMHFPDVDDFLNKHSIDIMAFESLVEKLDKEISRNQRALRESDPARRIMEAKDKRRKLLARIMEMKSESKGAFTAVLPKIVKQGSDHGEKMLYLSQAMEG